MLLTLLLLLVGLLPEPRAQAQAGAPAADAAPSDLKQNIANLSSLDFPVRMHAARLVRRTAESQAVPALVEAARRHPDEYVRYRALVLLTAFNDRGTRDLMRELIRDRNDRVREVAYRWLERNPDPQLTASLLASLTTEQSEFVRPALVAALAALAPTDMTVQRAMTNEVPRGLDFFRSAVIEALGRHRGVYAVESIVATSRLDGPLQDDALLALGRIGGTRAVDALGEFTKGTPEAAEMIRAARCLVAEKCAESIAALVAAASSEEGRPSTIGGAIDALEAVAQSRNEAALSALITLGVKRNALRERVAVSVASVALRQPDWVVERIGVADASTRETIITMLKDGFDSLDEDFNEEQFFAAVRAGYWRAADGSAGRTLAATLIQRLEF
ncbi:MAG TPA: HEAT repeat domain-containing protein [Vicinamibacterales bacterium]|nr:HEAT repeat domain-containing protein [Vicinamibacterales bacterium]